MRAQRAERRGETVQARSDVRAHSARCERAADGRAVPGGHSIQWTGTDSLRAARASGRT